MNPVVKYVALPALAPAAIFGLSFMPVTLVGCVNRGLLALGVVTAALAVAIALAVGGVRAGRRGRPPSAWPFLAIGILVLPALLLLGPLG